MIHHIDFSGGLTRNRFKRLGYNSIAKIGVLPGAQSHTAVDDQRLAGNKTGFIAGEKRDRIGNICRQTRASYRLCQ